MPRFAKSKDRRGCFLCNASVDQPLADAETRRLVEAGQRRMQRALAKALSSSRAYQGSAARNARARELLARYFGMRVLAKSGASIAMLEAVRRSALRDLAG